MLGVDVDQAKIAALASGEVPFFEPGLPEQLNKALESGRLRFTDDFAEAATFGDVHFICVGTPQQPGPQRRRPDLCRERRTPARRRISTAAP